MTETPSFDSAQELLDALGETDNPAEQATLLEANMEYAEEVFEEFDGLQDILTSTPEEIDQRTS